MVEAMSAIVPYPDKELTRCFEFTPTGLVIRGNPSFDEWRITGYMLKEMKGALRWWIGDWLNYGERQYGDMYVQEVGEDWGTYGALRIAKHVSSRFQLLRRRNNLGWAHHQEVAALEPREQDAWLDLAEQEDWSKAELRKQIRLARKTEALPSAQYRVIYADPPWEFRNIFQDQAAEKQYQTLPVEELKAMRVADIAADPSVLFLWSPASILEDALAVMAAWGFSYKTCMIWIKDRAPGIGWYVRTKHELLLIGTKGTGNEPLTTFDSCFEAPVTGHSTKPDLVYGIIECMYDSPYIELFARQQYEGWEAWGDEI